MRWFRPSRCTTTSRWITSLTISSIRSGFSTQSSLTGSLLFATTSTTMRCGLRTRRSCWAVRQSRPIISTAQLSLLSSIIYRQCHKNMYIYEYWTTLRRVTTYNFLKRKWYSKKRTLATVAAVHSVTNNSCFMRYTHTLRTSIYHTWMLQLPLPPSLFVPHRMMISQYCFQSDRKHEKQYYPDQSSTATDVIGTFFDTCTSIKVIKLHVYFKLIPLWEPDKYISPLLFRVRGNTYNTNTICWSIGVLGTCKETQ